MCYIDDLKFLWYYIPHDIGNQKTLLQICLQTSNIHPNFLLSLMTHQNTCKKIVFCIKVINCKGTTVSEGMNTNLRCVHLVFIVCSSSFKMCSLCKMCSSKDSKYFQTLQSTTCFGHRFFDFFALFEPLFFYLFYLEANYFTIL